MPSSTPAKPISWPQAGSLGMITIATNMAGRGTDIVLRRQC
jgi:preprotein translocase subunit SecA